MGELQLICQNYREYLGKDGGEELFCGNLGVRCDLQRLLVHDVHPSDPVARVLPLEDEVEDGPGFRKELISLQLERLRLRVGQVEPEDELAEELVELHPAFS